MSKLVVEVCAIDAVLPHGNADLLELCVVKGWQCVAKRGERHAGDKVVYVPLDTMMPLELSERLGITKYLSNGRVRCAKLRGEPSFGVIMDVADPSWEVGLDVAEFYGLTKYVPPVKITSGDAETPHPLLARYTEVENVRNFPDAFDAGETVVLTEKVHGTNCKLGLVEGEWMASSMGIRRRRPADDEAMAGSIYWFPYTVPGVRELVESYAADAAAADADIGGGRQVLLFGEVYGKVQTLTYGRPGRLGFVAFDLLVDGRYLDYAEFAAACDRFGVPRAPELAVGPYSVEFVRQHAGGNTTFAGADHVREGVVVKPPVERTHPKLGRLAMKYISDAYLLKREDGRVSDAADV